MTTRIRQFQEAAVSSQGQVTIPVSMRRALNIEPGSVVVFHLDECEQLTVKLKKRRLSVAELAGSVPSNGVDYGDYDDLFEQGMNEDAERITGVKW